MVEIWEYVKGKEKWGRRELYTGALHRFGRKDGVEIYRMVKKGMEGEEGNTNKE